MHLVTENCLEILNMIAPSRILIAIKVVVPSFSVEVVVTAPKVITMRFNLFTQITH